MLDPGPHPARQVVAVEQGGELVCRIQPTPSAFVCAKCL
jgi:hypothetical protein